jgi:hypothetical protein
MTPMGPRLRVLLPRSGPESHPFSLVYMTASTLKRPMATWMTLCRIYTAGVIRNCGNAVKNVTWYVSTSHQQCLYTSGYENSFIRATDRGSVRSVYVRTIMYRQNPGQSVWRMAQRPRTWRAQLPFLAPPTPTASTSKSLTAIFQNKIIMAWSCL